MNIKDIKNLDKDEILEMLGLKERDTTSSLFGSLGLLGVGLLVGAAVALFLTPQSGRDLRNSVGRKIKNSADDVMAAARSKMDEAQGLKG
jgi:gas vesicle protein